MLIEEIRFTQGDTPWEIACALINAEIETTNILTGNKMTTNCFTLADLKRIGEHIVNYCKTEDFEE